MIKLDKRLHLIYEMVLQANASRIVDVGCDHGKLGARCAETGMDVVLTDISAESLNKAKKLFETLKLRGKFICTNGLNGVDYHNALVAICGMGGEQILNILKDHRPQSLVLCPHQSTQKLRSVLVEWGYKIVSDTMVLNRGTFYDVLWAERGEDSLTDKELVFGRSNLARNNLDFEKFLLVEYDKFKKIAENIKINDTKVVKYVTMIEELLKGENYV